MEYKLELNRVKELPKNGEKVIIIELTDIQLHTNARPTKSIGGAIKRSIETNKPGRIFNSIVPGNSKPEENVFKIQMPSLVDDPVLKQTVLNYQKQGYRVLLQVPKNGLPVKAGADTQEFTKSVKGKRILNRIKKDKGL